MTQPTTEPTAPPPPGPDEPPPFLGRWRNVYLFVLAELALLILVFSALTWWAS